MSLIRFWFDGCCEPVNPGGHASAGTHVEQDGVVLLSEGHYIGEGPEMSNNVAEYTAFLRGLEFLLARGLNGEPIFCQGDSNLVIQQVFGTWKIHQGLYVPLAMRAKQLAEQFPHITAKWIPREQNDICDRLSKQPLLDRGVTFRIQPVHANR